MYEVWFVLCSSIIDTESLFTLLLCMYIVKMVLNMFFISLMKSWCASDLRTFDYFKDHYSSTKDVLACTQLMARLCELVPEWDILPGTFSCFMVFSFYSFWLLFVYIFVWRNIMLYLYRNVIFRPINFYTDIYIEM